MCKDGAGSPADGANHYDVNKTALMAAFWKQAAPAGRCKRSALGMQIPSSAIAGGGADDDVICRDDFLAWLFEKKPGSPSLLASALEARVSMLQAIAEHDPKPSFDVVFAQRGPGLVPSPLSDQPLWEEILVRFGAGVAPAAREAQHFLEVVESGMDPNGLPFPRMQPPCSWGRIPPRPASGGRIRGKAPMPQPDSTPFPLPHVCTSAPHTRAPPNMELWTVGAEAEVGEKWLAGLARTPDELRSATHGEKPWDMTLTPWPMARVGVIAADECTEAQLKVIELRAKRGPLSAERLGLRRAGMNLCVLKEVRPELEHEAALLEMHARWARDKTQATKEHDERSEQGAAFAAWPKPGERKWPPLPAAWKRHTAWFKMWRARSRASLALSGPAGGLKRSDSTSSLNSWLSVSDISWVEVQSQAAESGWQVVLEEAAQAPVLVEAEEMARQLNKGDLVEIKSFVCPPVGVKITMEVICVLLGVPPKRTHDDTGKEQVDYWEPSCSCVLNDVGFIDRLLALRDCLPNARSRLDAVAPYMAREDFTPEVIGKSSKACVSLCQWARELYKYHVMGLAAAEALRAEVARRPTSEMVAVAEAALKDLNKKDIQELKSLAKPPAGVDVICICLLHMFAGIDSCIALTAKGNVKEPCWKSCQALLGNPTFFLELANGFKDAIDAGRVPRRNVNAARRLKDGMGGTFCAEAMKKKSAAAAGICEWIVNMIAYYDAAAPPSLAPRLKPSGKGNSKMAMETMAKLRAAIDCEDVILNQVLPVLQSAAQAVNCLKKSDIGELKSLGKPPAECLDVSAACAFLLRNNEEKIDWRAAQEMMSNPADFITKVRAFDANVIPEGILLKIDQLLALPFFSYEAMKGKSLAAANLANWVINCVKYHALISSGVLPVGPWMAEIQAEMEIKQELEEIPSAACGQILVHTSPFRVRTAQSSPSRLPTRRPALPCNLFGYMSSQL